MMITNIPNTFSEALSSQQWQCAEAQRIVVHNIVVK